MISGFFRLCSKDLPAKLALEAAICSPKDKLWPWAELRGFYEKLRCGRSGA